MHEFSVVHANISSTNAIFLSFLVFISKMIQFVLAVNTFHLVRNGPCKFTSLLRFSSQPTSLEHAEHNIGAPIFLKRYPKIQIKSGMLQGRTSVLD